MNFIFIYETHQHSADEYACLAFVHDWLGRWMLGGGSQGTGAGRSDSFLLELSIPLRLCVCPLFKLSDQRHVLACSSLAFVTHGGDRSQRQRREVTRMGRLTASPPPRLPASPSTLAPRLPPAASLSTRPPRLSPGGGEGVITRQQGALGCETWGVIVLPLKGFLLSPPCTC